MKLFTRLALCIAAGSLLLAGCGKDGKDGAAGSNATTVVKVAELSTDQWANLAPQGQILSVTINNSAPVVKFKVTDANGNPIVGLGNTTKASTATVASYPNLAFYLAKLVPGSNGSPSKWVNYAVTTVPTTTAAATASRPTNDSTGTLVDNGDGTYQYTFYRDITKVKDQVAGFTLTAPSVAADLGDLTYNPSLTHRLVVQVYGNARGTGSNTADASNSGIAAVAMKNPANIVYDFIPATGKAVTSTDTQRLINLTEQCNSCHTKIGVTTPHGGRVDTRTCVVCHTDQRKFGYAEATTTATGYTGTANKINGFAAGDFPNMIHKYHMGEELTKTGYGTTYAFNEVGYPQDQRNCVKCHTQSAAAPQGDNWKTVPSRLACGSCHDSVNFATGAGHVGGSATSDANCALCHAADAIKTYHIPAAAPDPNNIYSVPVGGNNNTNASYVAAYTDNLPAGANVVTWDLNSVTINASGQPVFKFRFLKDGTPVTFKAASAGSELMDNFVGGPSVYLAFAVPQDGIAKPADWNATVSGYIRNIWNGSATGTGAGTMTAGTDGYYTLTLTGVKIPSTATMKIGGIGYTYGLTATQPLTQTNVPGYAYNTTTKVGGVSVPAPNVTKYVSGEATRRIIVSNDKCNACHGKLGIFTSKAFHAGQRNDAPTCTFCHNVNRVNSGWGVNIKEAVHAIHAGAKRVNKFSWEFSAGDSYWKIGYPAVLANCEQCHIAGTFDFSASTSSSALANLLWTTNATSTISATAYSIITGNEVYKSGDSVVSPFVTPGAVYGSGFTFNFATASTTPYVDAAGTTLVTSPITGACSACHDNPAALGHMKSHGGSFYAPRSTVSFSKQEYCLDCHGANKGLDIRTVHYSKFK